MFRDILVRPEVNSVRLTTKLPESVLSLPRINGRPYTPHVRRRRHSFTAFACRSVRQRFSHFVRQMAAIGSIRRRLGTSKTARADERGMDRRYPSQSRRASRTKQPDWVLELAMLAALAVVGVVTICGAFRGASHVLGSQ
jgi:hypothetical protein